ncbi:MAG: hypothetical protein QOJ03_2902, partial [Frankiaceae bacterium]|nr:hypothetical protein [Frankiaceae bacterium]
MPVPRAAASRRSDRSGDSGRASSRD